MEQEKIYQEKLTSKDQQIAEKDRQIEQLQAQLTNSETEKRLAVTDVLLPDVEEIGTNAFQGRDLRRVFIQSETIDEVFPGAFSPRYDKSWESII